MERWNVHPKGRPTSTFEANALASLDGFCRPHPLFDWNVLWECWKALENKISNSSSITLVDNEFDFRQLNEC
jgi:hypothetical protein